MFLFECPRCHLVRERVLALALRDRPRVSAGERGVRVLGDRQFDRIAATGRIQSGVAEVC